MNAELFNQIFPVLTAFAGALLGFFANLISNRIEFSRQIKLDKEAHLKELYDEFSRLITSTFNLFNDVFETLLDLEGVKLKRKEEQEIEIELEELFDRYHDKNEEYYSLSAKFNFAKIIDYVEEFDQINDIYKMLMDYCDKLDASTKSVPIGETEAK